MNKWTKEMTDFLWPLCRMIVLTTFLWMTFLFFLMIEDGYGAKVFIPSHNTCATHIVKHEKQHGIPHGLLHAISKAESGIKDVKGRVVAWPWTVNTGGQGYFFPTKQDAISAVKAMQAKGIKSIDVGCMQINLYHHPDAFENLEAAFEPSKNVAYAATFLTNLKNESKSWSRAVAHYHSQNPIHHIPYQKTVLRIWNRDHKGASVTLASEVSSLDLFSPPENHIRRLTTLKTLKSTSKRLTLVSSNNPGYRRKIGGSSHIRRLKLSSKE